MSPIKNNQLPGLASVLSPMISTSAKIAPIGKDQNRASHADQVFSGGSPTHGSGYQQSHSFPNHGHGLVTPTLGNLTSFGPSTSNASGVGTLTGPQFLWGSSTSYTDNMQSSAWQSRATGTSFMSNGQGQGQNFLYSGHHGSFTGSSHSQHHHPVGSAPSVVPFERQYGYFPESPETSFINQVAFGNTGINRNGGSLLLNTTPRATMNQGIMSGNMPDNSSPNMRMMPPQRFGPVLFPSPPYSGLSSIGIDGLVDRNRSRRAFHGKKWEKFNSEKVASLAYARIQGRAALIAHFQNSSLMNEDKRCRPILFDSEGAEAGYQVKDQ
ncbi:hypothetical protein GW17_00012288 [Ensete ventricosum]|nr:hypothetical protein GW17_00012288 [Ensete ventricosum]